jgi:hypothetical protein
METIGWLRLAAIGLFALYCLEQSLRLAAPGLVATGPHMADTVEITPAPTDQLSVSPPNPASKIANKRERPSLEDFGPNPIDRPQSDQVRKRKVHFTMNESFVLTSSQLIERPSNNFSAIREPSCVFDRDSGVSECSRLSKQPQPAATPFHGKTAKPVDWVLRTWTPVVMDESEEFVIMKRPGKDLSAIPGPSCVFDRGSAVSACSRLSKHAQPATTPIYDRTAKPVDRVQRTWTPVVRGEIEVSVFMERPRKDLSAIPGPSCVFDTGSAVSACSRSSNILQPAATAIEQTAKPITPSTRASVETAQKFRAAEKPRKLKAVEKKRRVASVKMKVQQVGNQVAVSYQPKSKVREAWPSPTLVKRGTTIKSGVIRRLVRVVSLPRKWLKWPTALSEKKSTLRRVSIF